MDRNDSARRRRFNLGRVTVLRACFAGILSLSVSTAQVNIATANGDNYRTNSNLEETQLTPRNVAQGRFGKLGAFPVDGQIYVQPLYVSSLSFPDGSIRNVAFVATMHNSVYAFDADMPSSAGLLWQVNLGPSFPTSLWNAAYTDISPEVGVLGTGAIDLQTKTLYVVAENLSNGAAAFYLHALDLSTGSERMNGPVLVSGGVTGQGAGAFGSAIPFNPNQHLQRPGLLLANNSVYVAFGSHMDQIPWHGWVISYSESDLTVQNGVFMTTPNGEGGAIWHSGRGLAADDAGNIYAMTGNGDFDGDGDLAESFLKLSGPQLTLADWFTPADWQALSAADADLSTGAAVIPGSHNLVGGDKYGQLYLVDGDNMGKLNAGASNSQIFAGAVLGGMFNFALWSQPGATLAYLQGYQDVVKAYRITGNTYDATPVSAAITPVAVPRVGMTISANGSQNGILWETIADSASTSGTLHAFDASNLAVELWNSGMNPTEDSLGGFSKFANPTVADGKVYVPTSSGEVAVYGLLCAARAGEASACSGPACRLTGLRTRRAAKCE